MRARLSEEHAQTASKNDVLRKKVTGLEQIARGASGFVLLAKYYSGDQINGEDGVLCCTHLANRNVRKVLLESPKERIIWMT